MNIVFCTNKMADGGAERVISLWAKGFCKQGDTVSIVLRNSSTPIQYDLPKTVKVYYLNDNRKSRLIGFLYRIYKLRKLLNTISPDYVITALSPWGLWAYLASFGKRWTVINTEHNTFERPESAPMTKDLYFYKYIVNKVFPFITVLTQADKDFIGRRLKRVEVLPNPLAFDIAQNIPNKEKLVLAVGRLDAWHVKGFDVLIKAWNIVSTKHRDWKLQIIGPGKQESIDFLKALISPNLSSPNIEFLGRIDDVKSYYQTAAILVSSSRYEGLGMVIFEAMSQGCACIATDYKGRQREIITNESEGIICEIDNVELLAQNIERMINDDRYREQVQKASIERSTFYSLDNIMRIWNTLIPIK